ncbi:hypothetical protein JOS77_22360 [Chromobacterium haemolyticum]|nr:hypothetical protein JOS77_22360 [Chromobacterium haemolyticum]
MAEPIDIQQDQQRFVGQLGDGKLQGPARIEQAGAPLARFHYQDGQLHGPATLLHPGGQPSAQLHYQCGQLHGAAQYWSPEGALQRQAHYRHGLPHGETRTLFPNGQPAELAVYRNGLKHGLQQRYHPNGALAERQRQNFIEGKPLGPPERFADDGRPLNADGKPMARWRWWWQKMMG